MGKKVLSLEDKSFVILKRLYGKVKHDTETYVSVFDLAGEDFTQNEAVQIWKFLIDEGWVKEGTKATGTPDLHITTRAIKEIEAGLIDVENHANQKLTQNQLTADLNRLSEKLRNALNDCNRHLRHQQEVKDLVREAENELDNLLPHDSTLFRVFERHKQQASKSWTVLRGSTYCVDEDCKHIEYWMQAVQELLNENTRLVDGHVKIETRTLSDKLPSFDPWGPIESLLFELDSDSVQNVISRVGVSINWQLTKAQGYSHKTRNRAYRERLTQANSNLSQDEKGELTTNVAKELIKINLSYRERIKEALENIGWIFIQDQLRPKHKSSLSIQPGSQQEIMELRKIFIIHGHDEGLKREVQLLISRAGVDDVVLHERPDKGRTLIDKLIEEGQGAAYVIALLSPDDKVLDGTSRARQNVILEIGYFLGKLGKSKIRLLKKGDIEIPSDLQGILYTEVDRDGAWRMKLLKEMKSEGIHIDLDKVLEKL